MIQKLQVMRSTTMTVMLLFVSFLVLGQAPTITSFAPTSASAGQTVIITGTNFESITAVTFGGTPASSFSVMSGSQIAAVVGPGTSGVVGVTKTGYAQVTRSGFTWTGSVMGITTDFQGFWKTSSTNVNTNYPDDAHNLLSFTYGNVTYSTGVNNDALNANNITYTAGNFRALPALFSGNTGSVLFCLGKKMDGSATQALPTSPLIKDLTFPDVLSDGPQGLNIGSGYANLPASATMTFRVKTIQLNKIADAEPDLVVTQIADPSSGSDTYRFIDASGNIVGNAVVQNLTLLPALSNYLLDIYTVPSSVPIANAKMNGIYSANTSRPIRLLAFKLSDFGINSSNVSQIHSFQILPSGTSDVAFVAYNANAINVPPTIGQNTAATNSVICPTGGDAYLEVTAYAASGGNLTYSWEVSTNGTTWTAITDNATYSGSTTHGLTITGATVGYKYRATVTESGSGYANTSPEFTITSSSGSALAGTLNPTGFTNCLGAISGTTTLSVAPTGGTGTFSYQWLSSSTLNGTYLPIEGEVYSSFTPSLAAAATTYYKVEVSSGCLSNTSNAATVVVQGAAITSVTDGERCGSGFVTLGASASAAGTFNWYNAPTGGSSLGTGASFNTPTLASSTNYYVAVTADGCTSVNRTLVQAIIKTTPTITSTVAASNCGTGSVSLQAVASAGDVSWYAAATGGTALGTGTSFTTPSISTTTTYYADATLDGCTTASRTAVVATINSLPTVSSVTGASRCGVGAVTLSATASAGTLSWYDTESGGSSLGTGTSFNTGTLSETQTFYVEAVNNGCSSAARSAVTATINQSVTTTLGITASATSVCSGNAITFTASATNAGASPVYEWYIDDVAQEVNSTTFVWNSPVSGSVIKASISTSGIPCVVSEYVESSTITLTSSNVTPTISISASTGTTVCAGTSVTFNVSTTNAGTAPTYQWWYNDQPVSTSSSYTVSNPQNGDYVACTLFSSEACASPSQVVSNMLTMTVVAAPGVASTTPNSRCGTGAVVLGATASSGTLAWYATATGGSSLGGGTTFTTPSISSTTTYYVQAGNGTCNTARTAVVATVNPIVNLNSDTFVVTNATNACAGSASTVTVSTMGMSNGTYTINYDITGANASTDNVATLTVSANSGTFATAALASAGASTIVVTDVFFGPCSVAITASNSKTVVVTAAPNASNFVASVNATCSNLQGTVDVASSSLASGTYVITYSITGTNTVTNATAQMLFTAGAPGSGSFNLPILANAGSNNNLTIHSINALGASCATTVNYALAAFENNLPVSMNAGTPIVSCTGNVVVYLYGNAVQYGGGTWDYTSGGTASASNYSSLVWSTPNGTGTFQNNTTIGALTNATYTPSAADIAAGSRLLTLTAQGNNGCSPVSQTISVTIHPSPTGGALTGSSSVCADDNSTTFNLSGNTGTLTRWESSPVSNFQTGVTTIDNTTTSYTVNDLTSTTYYRAVSQTGVCLSYATGSVQVSPVTVPGTITTASAEVCSGTAPSDLVLGGNVGSVVRWEWATDVNFTTPTSVFTSATTLTGSSIGNLTADRYYRALVKSGVCEEAYSEPILLDVISCVATVSKVRASQCGVLLPAISTNIYADNITNATAYRFEVTDGELTQYVTSNDRRFMLIEMATAPTYNTVYTIRVSVELNGVFGPYGTACTVTTPSPAGNTTQVQASQCGITLATMNTTIYANSVQSVTTYRFRITDGVNTAIIDSPDRMVTLPETGFEALGVEYTIDVAIELSGVFGDYGQACTVNSPEPPTTQVQPIQCGVTLATLGTSVYASTYQDATTYRFRITDGVSTTTIDSPDRIIQMTEVGFVNYATVYTIDVQVEVNEQFWPYGPACTVTTPEAPTTVVQEIQCGAEISSFTTLIFANAVEGATGYRFRVNDGDVEEIITSADRSFSLSELEFANYSTTYAIEVAVELLGAYQAYGAPCNVTTIDPPYDNNTTTKVRVSQCGVQLPSISTNIYADNVTGATAYKFKITKGAVVDSIISSDRRIMLTELPNAAYNSTYSIVVSVMLGGQWGPYGPMCYVYTPSPYGILSQVQAIQCGDTVQYFTTSIYANTVPGSTMYRFRVSDGVTASFIDSPDRIMNFAEFGITSFNTVYTIDVAVQKNGVFGPYGAACDVTTPLAPTTQIQATQCGSNMGSMNTIVYADSYPGATGYRFWVSDGANETVISKTDRFFTLSETGIGAFNTTYSVAVALEMYGNYLAYGDTCQVTSPGPATTQIQESQCGVTLAMISTTLYANSVPEATAYRFRVSDGVTTEEIDSPDRLFSLIETSMAGYSKTFTIDVAAQLNGTFQAFGSACNVTTPAGSTTKVQASQCGATLPYVTSAIYANSVAGAAIYRFRVSNGENTVVIDSPDRKLYLSETGMSAAGVTYSIDVCVSFAGFFGPYGDVCQVSSPGQAPVLTMIQPSQCGITLALVSTSIYANSVTGATGYRFRVNNGTTTQIVDSPDRIFNLTEAGFYTYDLEYQIDVAALVGGSYTNYGTVCSVYTPLAPTTMIQPSQCGTTLPFTTTGIKSNTVGGAQGYRFRVTDGVNTAIIDSPDRLIYLSETGFAANGTVYTIDVSVMLYNTYQAYGQACTVTTPGVAGFAIEQNQNTEHDINFRMASVDDLEEFGADVYPNPSSDRFNVELMGHEDGPVYVQVMDIAGKLIESIVINTSETTSIQMGDDYLAGVYMMRFTQGEKSYTVRVIKN